MSYIMDICIYIQGNKIEHLSTMEEKKNDLTLTFMFCWNEISKTFQTR